MTTQCQDVTAHNRMSYMIQTKVVKFGGTSLASAQNILMAKKIIDADPKRRFIVVSAPGRIDASAEGKKITDLLIETHTQLCYSDESKSLEKVAKRFEDISAGLGVDISQELERTLDEIGINRCKRDFVVSRGEYLMAILMAKLLDFRFVDASRLIILRPDSRVDMTATKIAFEDFKRTLGTRGVVVGGFYGRDASGRIKTMKRGGSDYSGAIAASLLKASEYENFTDVGGVQTANPSIVNETKTIHHLDYNTLHKLSLAGASVIFPDCLPLLKRHKIPLTIDNTMNPFRTFTSITNKQATCPFFSITYETKQNISKHLVEIFCIFHRIPIDFEDLRKTLCGHDIVLSSFIIKPKQSGEFTLFCETENLKDILNKLHARLLY